MEKIKININAKTGEVISSLVDKLTVDSDGIHVIFNPDNKVGFKVDDTIIFDKMVDNHGKMINVSSRYSTVIKVIGDNEIICNSIENETYLVDTSFTTIVKRDDNDSSQAIFGIKLNKPHGFYPQDLLTIFNYKNTGKNIDGLNINVSFGGSDPFIINDVFFSSNNGTDILNIGTTEFAMTIGSNTCDIDNFDVDMVFFKTDLTFVDDFSAMADSCEIQFNHNNIFLETDTEECLFLSLSTKEDVLIKKHAPNFNLQLGIAESDDYKSLMSELVMGKSYYDAIVNASIPGFIDMEKIKYEPYYSEIVDGVEKLYKIKTIKYIFHFRKRVKTNDEFDDGWYVYNDGDENNMAWNNGLLVNFDKNNSNYYKSDLLHYLDFTDDDVFYQKARLGKSFIRVSYYTSDNPVDQKLMFYSTIFFDCGELYGKYIKMCNDSEALNKKEISGIEFVRQEDGSIRLSTELTVKNSFNTDKSSDGFYCYLFREDKDLYNKNEGKNIYMKVEFNHAGKGRTIPMVNWEFDDSGKAKSMEDIKTYVRFLYNKISLDYYNGEYIYKFSDFGEYNKETGELTLVLFEPLFSRPKNEEGS